MVAEYKKSELKIVNDGELSLFFVGTGSAFSKINFQTNLLIIKGQDHVLVDCGTLCPYALETTYNTRLQTIRNLIVTHPHADHMGGVEELIFTSKYKNNNAKINIIIPNKFKKLLWNQSLRGGCQYSDGGKLSFDDYFTQLKPVKIKKMPFKMMEYNLGLINIKLFRTRHVTTKENSYCKSQYSLGLIIDDKVLYTADSQHNPEQINWICNHFNIETIFHDCDVSGFSRKVHAAYDELKTLPDEIKSKMYLCHYNSSAQKVNPVNDGFAGFAIPGSYYNFK